LSWIADVAGYEFVHGAAIGQNGVGVLLAGPSGVGKSTLSLRLALSGWDFLSDDFFLVDGLIASSVYQRVKLNSDSLKELGFKSIAEFSETSHSTKSIIDVTTIGKITSVPRLTIRGVAVSSLAPFSGVHSVPRSKVFMELASSTLAGLQGGSSQSFARLARVVSGSKLGQFGVMGPIPQISSALEGAMLSA
jgi:serine kinase of HPr protein (carbohydrate metabolism regulator)